MLGMDKPGHNILAMDKGDDVLGDVGEDAASLVCIVCSLCESLGFGVWGRGFGGLGFRV
jgi:hypothetical protein